MSNQINVALNIIIIILLLLLFYLKLIEKNKFDIVEVYKSQKKILSLSGFYIKSLILREIPLMKTSKEVYVAKMLIENILMLLKVQEHVRVCVFP